MNPQGRVAPHWAISDLLDEQVDLDALVHGAVEEGLASDMYTEQDPVLFLLDRENPQLPPWLPVNWGPNGRPLSPMERVDWFDELLRRDYGTSSGWPPNDDLETRRREIVRCLYLMYIDVTTGTLPEPSFVVEQGGRESSDGAPKRMFDEKELEQLVRERVSQELATRLADRVEKRLDAVYHCAGLAWFSSLGALLGWLLGLVVGWRDPNTAAELWDGGAIVLLIGLAWLPLKYFIAEQKMRKSRARERPSVERRRFWHFERGVMWLYPPILVSLAAILIWSIGWNHRGQPDTWRDFLEAVGIVLTGALDILSLVYVPADGDLREGWH